MNARDGRSKWMLIMSVYRRDIGVNVFLHIISFLAEISLHRRDEFIVTARRITIYKLLNSLCDAVHDIFEYYVLRNSIIAY